jgi:hypothetical protein
MLRSLVGTAVPAMVLLAGCPQECAPQPAATVQPAGTAFFEDFSDPNAFYARFDRMWSGDFAAGSAWGGNVNDWPADHDGSCGDPNTTRRTIHLSSQAQANDAAFFVCLPGGDPAKGHVMSTVNTEAYIIAWFSPKQTFANVHRVCWDQNIQFLGGGKWTQVLFLTQAEVARSGGDLGFTSPEYSDPGSTGSASGKASHGVKLVGGLMSSWSAIGEWNPYSPNTVQRPFAGDVGTTPDKAPRYQQCIVDNEDGTLTAIRNGPAGSVTSTVQGEIPNEPIRVVFEDDNYNPDKHNGASGVPTNSGQGYTWHWDNIQIS